MKQAKSSGRRKFLLAAGLGGVGAAAVAVTGRKALQGAAGAAPAGEARGYHVSEHILKYYKTTLV
jgi:hypothetical protein